MRQRPAISFNCSARELRGRKRMKCSTAPRHFDGLRSAVSRRLAKKLAVMIRETAVVGFSSCWFRVRLRRRDWSVVYPGHIVAPEAGATALARAGSRVNHCASVIRAGILLVGAHIGLSHYRFLPVFWRSFSAPHMPMPAASNA